MQKYRTKCIRIADCYQYFHTVMCMRPKYSPDSPTESYNNWRIVVTSCHHKGSKSLTNKLAVTNPIW